MRRGRRRGRAGFGWVRAAYCNRVSCPQVDKAQILICDFLRPHDVRSNGKDDLVFLPLFVFLGEEIFQYRKLQKPGIATERLCFRVLENSAHQVDFPIQ